MAKDIEDIDDDEDDDDEILDEPKDKKDKSSKSKKERRSVDLSGIYKKIDDRAIAIVLLALCGIGLLSALINLTGMRLPDSSTRIDPVDKWAIAFAPIVYIAPVLLVTVLFIRNSKDSRVKTLLLTAAVLCFCYAGIHMLTTVIELMHPKEIRISQDTFIGGTGGPTEDIVQPVQTNGFFPFVGTRGLGLFIQNLAYVALFTVIGIWALRPTEDESN